MTDVYSGHSQFVLLVNDRPRRWFDAKTVLLLTLVTLPVILFSGIYILILNGNEKLMYPKENQFEVPYLWLHRAKTYSYHHANSSHRKDFELANGVVQNVEEFKLVCYYNLPDKKSGGLQPRDVDPFLCTHINAAFANVVNNSLSLNEFQLEALKGLVDLKLENDKLKVLVSVGGAGNVNGFPEMVANHMNRKTFIRSVVDYVKTYKVDGVDLDWEFPDQNGLHQDQRVHFTQLLEEFRTTINKQIKHKFLVTVAVATPMGIVDDSYDVTYMNMFVDYVNLMTYDYHFYSKYTPFTGLNAPLYRSSTDKGFFTTLNINFSANYWNYKGMDRHKIVVGLPTYGHSFRLMNVHNNGLYAPARGYGKLGDNGFVGYNQICDFLDSNQISPVFDPDAKSPFATKSAEWVAFDDEQSLSCKAEFIRDQQFGGAMVYSLNTDDHKGACSMDPRVGPQAFPLTKKVREVLSQNYSLF